MDFFMTVAAERVGQDSALGKVGTLIDWQRLAAVLGLVRSRLGRTLRCRSATVSSERHQSSAARANDIATRLPEIPASWVVITPFDRPPGSLCAAKAQTGIVCFRHKTRFHQS